MIRPRVPETDLGIQGEFHVASYEQMQRSLKWIHLSVDYWFGNLRIFIIRNPNSSFTPSHRAVHQLRSVLQGFG